MHSLGTVDLAVATITVLAGRSRQDWNQAGWQIMEH